MKTSSSSLSISVSVLLIFFSVLTASTEGGTRRVLNSTKTGIAGRGMHGRFDRDYYDDILADINGDGDPPIPIIHVSGGKKDSNVKETAAAASTNNEGKDKEAEPRICKDASVTLPVCLFVLSYSEPLVIFILKEPLPQILNAINAQ
jgi:hypothetical protein